MLLFDFDYILDLTIIFLFIYFLNIFTLANHKGHECPLSMERDNTIRIVYNIKKNNKKNCL